MTDSDTLKQFSDYRIGTRDREDYEEGFGLYDDWALGVSDPNLPDGTNSKELLEEAINSVTPQDVFTTSSFSTFPDSFLIVNDIYFTDVPTAAISIDSQTDVFVGETLRSPAPVIDSEGRQDFVLRLSLPFPPGEAQSIKLKRLVSQISKHPFLFIYNNNIKQKLDVPENESTVFVLEAATLRSTQETVGLIVLDMQLHYFNYKPFSKHYYFNTALPGYTEEPDQVSRHEDIEIDLTEFGGYEASEHTISKLADRTRNNIRQGIKNLTRTKRENVPVNMPSESDAWMYFANHLETQSEAITGIPSDYIGFTLREYMHFNPPDSKYADGESTLADLMNSRYEEVSPLYRADKWQEALAKKHDEETKYSVEGTTAQERRYQEEIDLSLEGDITAPVKFTNPRGQKLTIQLLDENGNVPTNARYELTKFADRRKLTKDEAVFLSPDLIRKLALVAKHFSGRTIEIISTQRDPGWVKKRIPRPSNWKPSYHIQGKAIDFRVRGIPNQSLYEYIKTLPNTGAGFYPNSVFCHMDARNSSFFWVDLSGKGENSNYALKTNNVRELNKYLNDHYRLAGDSVSSEIDSDIEEIESNLGTDKDREKQAKDIAQQKGNVADLIERQKELNKHKTEADYQKAQHRKEQKTEKNKNDRMAWIESIEKQHGVHYYYDDPKVRNVFYRDMGLNISSDPTVQRSGAALKNMVCSAISVSFGHRIAPIPLLSQSFYTYQFLGSGNKSGQIVLTFAGEEGKTSAQLVKRLIWKARDNARDFTSVIKSVGSIGLEHTAFGTGEQNTIMALANIDNIVVTDIKESNSPEGADKHQLVIEFIAQEFAEEKLEERFTTTLDTKKRIIRAILQHVKSRQPKNALSGAVQHRAGRSTDPLDLNAIFVSHDLVSANTSSEGKPYRLIGDTPLWVARLLVEAANICKEANDKMPPVNWQVSKGASATWQEVYKAWGAGSIMRGKTANIDSSERNATGIQAAIDQPDIDRQNNTAREYSKDKDSASLVADSVQASRTREQNGIYDKNGGPKTNKFHKQVFDEWLSKMNLIVNEFKTHLNDGEIVDKYFSGVLDNLTAVIAGDISSCYLDIGLPNVPGAPVPLPPEFFLYDDSHEDPLVSNMTDDSNMERLLKRHVETEMASIKHYIDESFLGGSYLSKNLPRILEQRASDHERFEGERNFSTYYNYFTHGAKSWEPIYTRRDEQDPAIKGVRQWLDSVASHYGSADDKEQRINYLKNIIELSPYIASGRHWETPLTEQDNSALVRSLYKDAEDVLAFGPNPIYGHVDATMRGQLEDPANERRAQAIENKKAVEAMKKPIPPQYKAGLFLTGKHGEGPRESMELPGRTVLADGAVTFGQTEAEKKDSKPSFFDELVQMGKDFADADSSGAVGGFVLNALSGGSSLGGSLSGLYQGSKIVEKAAGAIDAYALDAGAAKYDHAFSKMAQEDEIKQIAQTASRTALGRRRNDLSMRRAYPTFKIYFIEDDSGETELIDDGILRAFDDFYSYSAIQEIKVTRSRHIAADMAVIRMTNIGGLLLRKRFGENDKDLTKYGINAEKQGIFADTEREHPFEKMILQDGIKVQIRLGYAANPEHLETVFLGQIVEVGLAERGKIIEIACQGYGAELESVELGPLENGKYFLSSQQVLSGAIIQDSIANFGRQDRFNRDNPAAMRHSWTGGRATGFFSGLSPSNIHEEWSDRGLETIFNRYQFLNYQQDDNIYAPPPETYSTSWTKFWNNACIYRPLKQTPWQIFKEHELRHPGYISLAVPYGHSPRMTMFFGSKMQHYWSKPPSSLEIELARGAKNDIVRMRKQGLELFEKGMVKELVKFVGKSPKLGAAIFNDVMTIGTRYDTGFAIGELFGRYVPFRNYHYFDSYHHILKNNIRSSVDGTFNEVEIYYTEDENDIIDPDRDDLEENVASVARGYEGLLAVKLDENIPESAIRSFRGEYPSCVTVDMARRYAQGIFGRTLRDAYKGELCVIGDEKLKPYDVCYLNDASINMTGPIEVESVTHIFNRDNGFVSIITPDLCLEVNDYYTSSVFDVTASAMNFTFADWVTGANILKGVGFLGLLAGVKFMTWTQDGAPVVATPLTLGGKPFISNSLGPNRVSLFFSLMGKWNQYWDDLGDAWRKFDVSEAFFENRVNLVKGFYEALGSGAQGGLEEA